VADESSQRDDSLNPPVIEFLLQVKGIVFMAMLDIGSSRMLIEHQFCEDNGVEIQEACGFIQLGQKGVKVLRVGVTTPLCLSMADQTHAVISSLEVKSLLSKHVVVVGCDLMPPFHICMVTRRVHNSVYILNNVVGKLAH
jgi:hypothetical protein